MESSGTILRRRLIRAAIVSLVMGVGLSLGTAALCYRQRPTTGGVTFTTRFAAMRCAGFRVRGWGFDSIDFTAVQPADLRVNGFAEFRRKVQETAIADFGEAFDPPGWMPWVSDVKEPVREVWVEAAGWPLRCIAMRQVDTARAPSHLPTLPGTSMLNGPAFPSIYVLWRGLAVNTVGWAMLVFIAIRLIGVARVHGRRCRGRCPMCGYDLLHDFKSGCPECGWNRPPIAAVGDG